VSFGSRPDEAAPAAHFPGPFAAFALTIGALFAVMFAMRFVMLLFGAKPTLASFGVGEAIGVGAVATFAARRVADPQRERLGLKGFDSSFVPMLIALLPALVLISELDNILRSLVPPPEIPEEIQQLQEDFVGTGPIAVMQTVLIGVGIAPVVEEWLFRGVIQQGLVSHLARARGVILTAGLYAMVHVGPSPSAAGNLSPFLASFALGVLLGCVRLATGSVLAPILLSAGISALGLAAIGAADSWPIDGLNVPDTHTSLDLLFASIVAVAWGLRGLIAAARAAPVTIPLPGAEEET
jgi:membrane protease YdiL (CAAX protease family)